jgi:hypothetical protein
MDAQGALGLSRYDRLHFAALRAVARLEGLDEPTPEEFARIGVRGTSLREGMLAIEKTRPRKSNAARIPHHAARQPLGVVQRVIPANALLRVWQRLAVMALRSML